MVGAGRTECFVSITHAYAYGGCKSVFRASIITGSSSLHLADEFVCGAISRPLPLGHQTLCKAVYKAGRSKDGAMVRDASLVFLKMHFPLDQLKLSHVEKGHYHNAVEYLERQSAL